MIQPASNVFFRKVWPGSALEESVSFCQSLGMRKAVRQSPPVCSHQWIDLVDLMAHRAMASKIRREPKLFNRARRNIARWEKNNRGCPPPLREWKEILQNNDLKAVLRIMTRTDEEGNRLRQSSPFCGILTEREREAIWARYDQE